MEKNTVSGIMITLLLISVLTLAFSIQPAEAQETIYIRADGSIDPPTAPIQRDGDTYSFTADIYDSIVVEKDSVLIDGNGHTLQGSGTGNGFTLYGRTDVTIKNVGIVQFYAGISLVSSTNNMIIENTVSSNTHGIHLLQSTSCTVSNNTVTSNQGGIIVYQGSDYTMVRDNTVEANAVIGIDLGMADWCTVTRNNLTNNMFGIWLDYSSDNTLSGNVIKNSVFGARLDGSPENTFYHNNFVDNTNQVYTVGESFNNVWDAGYPSGGNYWSDYTGVDLYGGPNQDYPSGSDGIGDSAYVIDAGNQDRYPLMSPWVERTVGVEDGDWAKYKYEFTWSSTDPNEQPPQDLVDFVTRLDWYGINVLEVFGTTVAFQTVIHFKEGTETKSHWIVDINNGSGNGTYLIAFIAANLNPNEALCTFPPQFTWCGWQIEETISRQVAGAMREINHLDVTNWSFIGPNLPPEFDSIDDFCWDRATGILCEHSHTQAFEKNGYTTSLSLTIKMINTNIWKPPVISATLNIDPDTMNLKSKGQWITAYIQLTEGYDPAEIDASTILLNDTISPVLDPKYGFVTNPSEYLVDHNGDGILERMVKFERIVVESLIYNQGIRYGDVALTLAGKLLDGTPFEGTDVVFVNYAGDVNNDGMINILDAAMVSAHWYPGPPIGLLGYDANADLNNDGVINIFDCGIVSNNWGQTTPQENT